MKKSTLQICLAAALTAACVIPAFSQVKPDTQVRQRQAAMTLQGKYFNGYLRPVAQGKLPYDAAAVARNVGYMDSLSRMPWDGFTPATKEIKSRATGAIFTDTAKFKEAQDHYMAEMTKLVEVTRKGDEASIKNQILAVDKSCNACHDNFRERN